MKYLRPRAIVATEIEIKNSRFIGYVAPTKGREEAMAFVQSLREKYPDARHHCWSHIAGEPNDSSEWGFSDDGEPRGTAGKPMLNILLHSGYGELTAVVVRYFGGIKLGTGGLVRAYSQATQAALECIESEPVIETENLILCADYAYTGELEQLLGRHREVEVLERHWGDQLKVELRATPENAAALRESLAALQDKIALQSETDN